MKEIKKFEKSIKPVTTISSKPDEEALDLSAIDLSNIDYDFSKILVSAGAMVHGDIQTINPLNVFSHQIELDLDKLNKEGFITPKYSNTLLANSYRMIKRPLLNNINGKSASTVDNANLIMVTSSLPGEGKTFSAINLAISMAMEKDKRVLLVDADTNKPSHYKLFGIENRPGLTDFLLNEVNDMGDVLCRTNIPSLSIMSSGKMYEYSTELLASAAMDKFINEISNRYKDRVVIFDSPPLLQTTESSVLAAHMGQIVMVVEAENTQNHMVKKSLSLLSNEIVLLLLNKQREKIHEGHYGYGYGYGHQH